MASSGAHCEGAQLSPGTNPPDATTDPCIIHQRPVPLSSTSSSSPPSLPPPQAVDAGVRLPEFEGTSLQKQQIHSSDTNLLQQRDQQGSAPPTPSPGGSPATSATRRGSSSSSRRGSGVRLVLASGEVLPVPPVVSTLRQPKIAEVISLLNTYVFLPRFEKCFRLLWRNEPLLFWDRLPHDAVLLAVTNKLSLAQQGPPKFAQKTTLQAVSRRKLTTSSSSPSGTVGGSGNARSTQLPTFSQLWGPQHAPPASTRGGGGGGGNSALRSVSPGQETYNRWAHNLAEYSVSNLLQQSATSSRQQQQQQQQQQPAAASRWQSSSAPSSAVRHHSPNTLLPSSSTSPTSVGLPSTTSVLAVAAAGGSGPPVAPKDSMSTAPISTSGSGALSWTSGTTSSSFATAGPSTPSAPSVAVTSSSFAGPPVTSTTSAAPVTHPPLSNATGNDFLGSSSSPSRDRQASGVGGGTLSFSRQSSATNGGGGDSHNGPRFPSFVGVNLQLPTTPVAPPPAYAPPLSISPSTHSPHSYHHLHVNHHHHHHLHHQHHHHPVPQPFSHFHATLHSPLGNPLGGDGNGNGAVGVMLSNAAAAASSLLSAAVASNSPCPSPSANPNGPGGGGGWGSFSRAPSPGSAIGSFWSPPLHRSAVSLVSAIARDKGAALIESMQDVLDERRHEEQMLLLQRQVSEMTARSSGPATRASTSAMTPREEPRLHNDDDEDDDGHVDDVIEDEELFLSTLPPAAVNQMSEMGFGLRASARALSLHGADVAAAVTYLVHRCTSEEAVAELNAPISAAEIRRFQRTTAAAAAAAASSSSSSSAAASMGGGALVAVVRGSVPHSAHVQPKQQHASAEPHPSRLEDGRARGAGAAGGMNPTTTNRGEGSAQLPTQATAAVSLSRVNFRRLLEMGFPGPEVRSTLRALNNDFDDACAALLGDAAALSRVRSFRSDTSVQWFEPVEHMVRSGVLDPVQVIQVVQRLNDNPQHVLLLWHCARMGPCVAKMASVFAPASLPSSAVRGMGAVGSGGGGVPAVSSSATLGGRSASRR